MTSPPPALSASCSAISTPYMSESSICGLPERSRVLSSSSVPGTFGSGICFTQTAMFMGGFWPPEPLRFQTGGTVGDMAATRPVEVLVVGAGPAGAAAAIESRRLGLDVLAVDKARFPRDKTCGDGLTTGALRRLEQLGVDVRALASYASVTETVLV